MELSCHPSRLDLEDVALMAAKERGTPVVLDSDAHAVEELAFMELGVYQARRAGFEVKDVINTRPLARFRKLLTRRRPGFDSGACVKISLASRLKSAGSRFGLLARWLQPNSGIGDPAALPGRKGEDRIQIELADLRHLLDQLGHA